MPAEHRLALLGAGTAARRTAMRVDAEALARQVEWRRFADLLRARKLLGVLGPRIVELDVSPDPVFLEEVRQATEAGRRHGAFLALIGTRLGAMLGERGIFAATLKGPDLSEAIYGDPGRRLSSDIDLLVAPSRLAEAVEVARGIGYRSPTDFVDRSGLPLLHFALVHPRDELPPVELHWRVHWYEARFAEEMLLPAAGEDPAGWRPAPAAELAALALFYARDGFVDLRQAVDLGAWWDAFGDRLEVGEVAGILSRYPELERAISTALAVAERVVGLPAAEILGAVPRLGARQRMAARLADPNPTSRRSQLHADMGLIDGLLTPTGDLGRFARRQIFLPRAVFRQYAGHAEFRARSPFDYALRVLARYGLAALRALRRPQYA